RQFTSVNSQWGPAVNRPGPARERCAICSGASLISSRQSYVTSGLKRYAGALGAVGGTSSRGRQLGGATRAWPVLVAVPRSARCLLGDGRWFLNRDAQGVLSAARSPVAASTPLRKRRAHPYTAAALQPVRRVCPSLERSRSCLDVPADLLGL